MGFYRRQSFWSIWLMLVFKFPKKRTKRIIWSIIFENWMSFSHQLSTFLSLDNQYVTTQYFIFHQMNAKYFKQKNDVLSWFVLRFIVLMKFQRWNLKKRKLLRKKAQRVAKSQILEEDLFDSNLKMSFMIL